MNNNDLMVCVKRWHDCAPRRKSDREAMIQINGILAALGERAEEKGGVSEEERRNFIAHYFWLAGRTEKGVRHIKICLLCQKMHRLILSGKGKAK